MLWMNPNVNEAFGRKGRAAQKKSKNKNSNLRKKNNKVNLLMIVI